MSRRVATTLTLAIAAASFVMARPVPQPKPVWLILVDDFHLQFKSTGHLRGLVRGIVSDVIQEGEEFTIVLSSGYNEGVPRTSDRDRVGGFASKVAGMGLRPTDKVIPAELELRERLMLEAASRLLDSVADDKDRRIRLIVISNGWQSGPDGQTVHTLVSRAKALAVPIVTIDPEQLVRSREPNSPADPKLAALLATAAASLRALADRTGGLAILDSGELAAVLDVMRKALKLPGNPVRRRSSPQG